MRKVRVTTDPSRNAVGIFLFALLACLSLLSVTGCSSSSQNNATSSSSSQNNAASFSSNSSTSSVATGKEAPDFEFTRLDGTAGKLSDYRGHVVLLDFWATWCGYCVKEMPYIQQLAQKYPDLIVLAVNRKEDISTVKAFVDSKGYSFVWASDENGSIAKLYPSSGIPYSMFIDADGVVHTIFKGSPSDVYSSFENAAVEAGA